MAKEAMKINGGVMLTASVLETVAGGLSAGFHVVELLNKKSYDPLKDGVRDFVSGYILADGFCNIVKSCKIIKNDLAEKKAAAEIEAPEQA